MLNRDIILILLLFQILVLLYSMNLLILLILYVIKEKINFCLFQALLFCQWLIITL
nr:MAG TPA: hypothetical protein [Caudoviricetes sp.]